MQCGLEASVAVYGQRSKQGTKPAFCQLAIESSGIPDEERICTDREQVVSRHGGSQGGINKKTRWILPLRASLMAARAKAPNGESWMSDGGGNGIVAQS